MKVAITHDYLIDFGGAERVLVALHEIYPQAPIYTAIFDKAKMSNSWQYFKNMNIKTSWFNSLPFATKLISPLRFLVPFIWKGFDLSNYDLIIDSSAWAMTRGFKRRNNQTEICYCHTPPRYLYGFDTSRNWNTKWFGKLVKIYSLIVNHFLRIYDWNSAQKVDFFIANSENVKKRIEKFYRKDSIVIYPPVEVEKIIASKLKAKEGEYYITGGRLVAAKNFDLIIKTFKNLEANLVIFGDGILERQLKKIASPNITFLGNISDEELISYLKGAKAFVAAQKDEDFGMTLIESQAAGTPVITYRGGGYLESIVENKTGIFFDELTIESLTKAINKFQKLSWDKKVITANAKRFSKERFKREILGFIRKVNNA